MSHQQSFSFEEKGHRESRDKREQSSVVEFPEPSSQHERDLQKKIRDEIGTILEVSLDDADFAEILLNRDEIDSVLENRGYEANYDHANGQVKVRLASEDDPGEYHKGYKNR